VIVYIAGKISGFPDYKQRFAEAAARLAAQGHIPLNPALLPEGMPYESYFPICFAMIDVSEAVYMLENYRDSNGALRELAYAGESGKRILFEGVEV